PVAPSHSLSSPFQTSMLNTTDTHEKVICLLPVNGPNEIYGYIGIVIIALLAVYSLTITVCFCVMRKKSNPAKPESAVKPSELTRLSNGSGSSRTDKEEKKKRRSSKYEKKKCRVSESKNVRTETVDDVHSNWGPVQPEVM
ncbi:hypothetical protein PENTCL1PPCAC_10189, partial [Pristionchus entomophagus]